jgi:CubicO group peptidase (beta-lactamase class C family)
MLKHRFCLIVLFFLLPLFLNAQTTVPETIFPIGQHRSDTMNDALVRAQIPGKTMGQKLESLLFWSEEDRLHRFPIMQNIFPSVVIATGKYVFPLEKGSPLQPKWKDNEDLTAYMQDNHIAGVLVLQNDQIRLEAYGKGIDQNTVWASFSMAKSVSSMLLGIALKEGTIHSLEDSMSQYIPELKGKDYGKITVRQLLTMTSGIAWNEDYEDHLSNVAQMYLHPCEGQESHILTYMKSLHAAHPPGTVWNYSTGETDLLGVLIQKATGMSLAAYLSEKIWEYWGMAHKAYWLTDECSGLNLGGSGLSATLRDYARLGTVMLHQGKKGDLELFSKQWLDSATAKLYQTDEKSGGYGYLWWSYPNGSYTAIGIFGQMIYVNPQKNLVIAQIAAWPKATSKELVAQRRAFVEAIESATHP